MTNTRHVLLGIGFFFMLLAATFGLGMIIGRRHMSPLPPLGPQGEILTISDDARYICRGQVEISGDGGRQWTQLLTPCVPNHATIEWRSGSFEFPQPCKYARLRFIYPRQGTVECSNKPLGPWNGPLTASVTYPRNNEQAQTK